MQCLEPGIHRPKKICGFRPKRSENGRPRGASSHLMRFDSQKLLLAVRVNDPLEAGGEAGSMHRHASEGSKQAQLRAIATVRDAVRAPNHPPLVARSSTRTAWHVSCIDRSACETAGAVQPRKAGRREATRLPNKPPVPQRTDIWICAAIARRSPVATTDAGLMLPSP
jgi:hypothetical protein